MFVLLSSENKIQNEGAICNELFHCGLPLLHLRKPEVEKEYFLNLLKYIDPKFHSKISLHQHHDLAETFKIGALHYTEKHRTSLGNSLNEELQTKKAKGLKLSTSIHSLENYFHIGFDYQFLSPLFDSISKTNYLGKQIKLEKNYKNIIGLGGINSSNIFKAKEWSYSGIAVLGAVWNSKNPLLAFSDVMEKYNEAYSEKMEAHA